MLSVDKRDPYISGILGERKAPASQTIKPSFVTSSYRVDIKATEVVFRLYDSDLNDLSDEFYVDSRVIMREAIKQAIKTKTLYPFNKMEKAVQRFKNWLKNGRI